jgi:hypothetical protein
MLYREKVDVWPEINTKHINSASAECTIFLARSQNCEKQLLASSRPSVRTEQFGSHWADFHEIWPEYFYENLSTKFKFRYNRTRITGTLQGNQYVYILVISCSIFLVVRYVSEKSCRENQNTHYMFKTFFSLKSYRLWDYREKCGTNTRATDDNITRRKRIAC